MNDLTPATMSAAVFHGDRRITVERRPVPEVGPGEVMLRVSRTALCGSDFKLWLKGAEYTAGHEIFGRVEQPGHSMDGRRCAVYIPTHCNHCDACRRGDTQMCLEQSSLIGWNRPGGYAEYVPVPEKLSAAGAGRHRRRPRAPSCSTPSAPRPMRCASSLP